MSQAPVSVTISYPPGYPNRFLPTLLADFEFPEAIVPDVITTYAPRYHSVLCKNRHLGVHALSLLDSCDPASADYLSLIKTANPFVLDAVLSSSLPDEAARAIASTWALSLADQLRLARQPLSAATATFILSRVKLCPPARNILLEAHNIGPNLILHTSLYVPSPIPLVSTSLRSPAERPAAVPDPSVSILDLTSYNANLIPLALYGRLDEYPLSPRAWMLFLSLVEDDPDVPLVTALSSARHLAAAEVPSLGLVSA